ncbi:MAG TPA: hypothetical protein VEH58_07690 [Dehalococcoidales bacterium]|nr:hypothetical protein [Dehalococcoidales bacterium]
MGKEIVDQVEQILHGYVNPAELAEIEKIIAEAKGRLPVGKAQGYWEGKSPCWEMSNCPESIRKECPAFKNTEIPCWEIEGTYCKLDDRGATGRDTSICQVCRVHQRYEANSPINITLFGQGFATTSILNTK